MGRRLWPDGTFVDFDHGLNAIINRLRDTLGDSADPPRFIETLPRRGYRFIAPVKRAKKIGRPPASERLARRQIDVVGCRDSAGARRSRLA